MLGFEYFVKINIFFSSQIEIGEGNNFEHFKTPIEGPNIYQGFHFTENIL